VADTISYAPTEELDLIRSTTRQFLEEKLPLTVVRELMMSEEGFERGLWKDLAAMGWTGLLIPEQHGGAGLDTWSSRWCSRRWGGW
jgi:alkylation response protein AidB-like acyl-CoA dehydrogenase